MAASIDLSSLSCDELCSFLKSKNLTDDVITTIKGNFYGTLANFYLYTAIITRVQLTLNLTEIHMCDMGLTQHVFILLYIYCSLLLKD